ncbi:MAG: hypothetical protein J6U23_02115 [Clostridiales bacterium]|nr:hypothetical protein [Clostridiales bacterium]
MKKGNFWVYIGILAVAALALLVFVFFSDSLFDGLKKTSKKDNITELKEQLASQDLKIYWIGDCPSRLKDVNFVQVHSIKEENLPLSYRYVQTSELVDKTMEYELVRIDQECPTYSVIVITKTGLTDEERGYILRCMEESGTKLILLGKDAVDEYRASLYMATGPSIKYTSMIFEDGVYHDDIFSSDSMKNVDSPEFAQEFMEYLINDFEFTDSAAETSESAH